MINQARCIHRPPKNRHYKKYQSKLRGIEKQPPSWFMNQGPPKKYVDRPDYNRLRNRLLREYHWHSGMVQVSTGRSKLKQVLKSVVNAYNYPRDMDNNANSFIDNDTEILSEKASDIYERWEYRY